MKNILTYIKNEGNRTFEEFPFNEVDSLILSQLTYLEYDGIVPKLCEDSEMLKAENEASCELTKDVNAILLKDIPEHPEFINMFNIFWMADKEEKLVSLAAKSKRYCDIQINFYKEIFSEDFDTQFAAVTYILPDKSMYVAFRGTDATLLGWKEDMKIGYSKPIESQKLAAEYMNRVSGMNDYPIRTGGHSKGGNLAIYASMMCEVEARIRIIDIYNHDGPGFRPEIIENSAYSSLADRIHKYIPKSSIVGIIFEDDNYDIVESYGVGALQHNAFSWKVENGEFIRCERKFFTKEATDQSINEWIYSLKEEELDVFVNSLYDILTAKDAKTIEDLKKNPFKSFTAAVNKYKELSFDNQEILEEIFKRMRNIYGENVLEAIVVSSRNMWQEMVEFSQNAGDKVKRTFSKKKG